MQLVLLYRKALVQEKKEEWIARFGPLGGGLYKFKSVDQ
jgi:hypothetical protein